MKKIISMILIITMLLSMVTMTVPALAADGVVGTATNKVPTLSELGIDIATGAQGLKNPEITVTEPTGVGIESGVTLPVVDNMMITHVGTDGNDKTPVKLQTKVEGGKTVVTNVGNVVVNDSNRAAYVQTLVAAGYTAVSTFDQLKTAYKNDAKIYLTANISGNTVHDQNKTFENIVIDGCGYTLTVTGNKTLFGNGTNKVTFKNITIAGTINETADNRTFHLLDKWGNSYVSLYNVTVQADLTVSYSADVGKGVSLLSREAKNVTWKNVLAQGTITYQGDNCKDIDEVASIAGKVSNGTLNSVVNNTTILVDGTNSAEAKRGSNTGTNGIGCVGGIVGNISNSTISNCYNIANITLQNVSNYNADRFGGLFGWVTGCNVSDCINTGTLTFSSKGDAKVASVGGVIGATSNTCTRMLNLTNTGKIVVSEGATSYVGGVIGQTVETGTYALSEMLNTGDIEINGNVGGVGGIVGGSTALIEKSVNSGKITYNGNGESIGGIAGVINGANITNCINKSAAVISVTSTATTDQYRIGGIAGIEEGTVTVSHCANEANINVNYQNSDRYIVGTGGIVGVSKGGLTVEKSINKGKITTEKSSKPIATGGIIGVIWGKTVTVDGCINEGNIEHKASGDYNDGVGGIIGLMWNASAIEIKNSFNEGNITLTADGSGVSVGGIFGAINLEKDFNSSDANVEPYITITNCHNGYKSTRLRATGTITVKRSGNNAYVGGVAGLIRAHDFFVKGLNATFTNCTNNGKIDYQNGATGYSIAGIASIVKAGKVESCANYGDIIVNGNVGHKTSNNNGGYDYHNGQVAGIVIQSSADVVNCLNRGDITIGATCSLVTNVVGIVAKVVNSYNSYDVNNKAADYEYDKTVVSGCVNEGNITVEAGSNIQTVIKTATDGANGANFEGIAGIVGLVSNNGDKNTGVVTVEDCWNKGNITINEYLQRATAGIVAYNTARNIKIDNCLNSGNITGKSGHNKDHTQIAGILAMNYQSASRAVVMQKSVEVLNCTNLGVVADSNTDKASAKDAAGVTKNSVPQVGGIVANVRGIPNVTIYNCVNGSADPVAEGAVAPGTVTGTLGSGAYVGVGGILGLYGSVGNTWMMETKPDDGCKLTVEKVINYAPVSGTSERYVGSLFGSVGSVETVLSHKDSKLLFKDCVNGATVTHGLWGVGGVLNVVENEFMEFVECANIGSVTPTTGGQKTGGIIGVIQKPITVRGCVNAGVVAPPTNTQHQFVGGIVASIEAAANIIDCVNLQDLQPTGKGYDSGGGDGDQGVGGIVGYHYGSKVATLDGCKNYGKIFQTGMPSVYGLGGMVGTIWNNGAMDIIDCENYGTIEVDNIHGTVSGVHGAANLEIAKDNGRQTSQGAGGMVGSIRFNNKVNIIGCTNNGLITVTEDGGYYNLGGMVGNVYKNTTGYVNVEGCVNNGDLVIDSQKGSEMHGAGGIMGRQTLCTTVTISDCINNGDLTVTDEAYDYNLSGILASAQRSRVDIFNCHNTGNMKIRDRNVDKPNNYAYSYNAAAGILGYAYSNGYDGIQDVHVESCSNSGKIYNYDAANNPGWVAGVVGIVRSTSFAEIVNCVNTGEITSVKSMTGGILAWSGTVGLSWSNTDESELVIKGCYNSGKIEGSSSAGGIMGGMAEYQKSSNVSDHKITFIECVNDGDVLSTGSYAGGIMAAISAVTLECEFQFKAVRCVNRGDVIANSDGAGGILGHYANGIPTATVTVSQCVNEGLVSSGFGKKADGTMNSGGNAGGIVGTLVSCNSTVNVEQCANYGIVKAHNWNTGGILGQINNTTANVSSQMVTVKNCVNLGTLMSDVAGGAKENPITFSGQVIENNCYVKTTVEKDYDKFTAISEADAKKMAEKFTFFVTDASALSGVIAEAKKILDNADAYDAGTIADLRYTYTEAVNLFESAPIGIAKNNGVYKMYVANATNIQAVIDALNGTEGIGGVVLKGQIWKALEMAIADAEKFIEENTTAYDVNAWNEFNDHLVYCKGLIADINVNDENNYDVMNDAMRTLRALIKNLKGNNEVQGKIIYTADELVLLEGSNANFYLGADITVTKPVKSFGGNLYGNGYDIVLAGSALFEEFKAAIPTGEYVFTTESFSELGKGSINNVTVVGDAGAANSVFGKVTGSVTVKDVVIDLPALKVAAIFHAAGDHAEIYIENALVNTESQYALLGDMNGKVEIKNVIAMGGAEAFVGETTKFQATTAYLDGVTYYNDKSEVVNEAIASGEVAYLFNNKLKTLAAVNDNFGDYYLVQTIVAGSKPSFGRPNANSGNVVVYDSTTQKYVNAIKDYFDDTIVIPELDKTVPTVYTMLKAALARASVFVEDEYTAESWLLLKSAIDAGNAALQLTDQDAIDEAVAVLNVIMASMEKKSNVIDYSALIAALDDAAKLVKTDYTSGSWNTFQAILTMAKIARLADTQSAVDSAVASLKSAVDGLVKVEAPADEPSDEPSEEPSDDEEPVEEPAEIPMYVIIAAAGGALLIIAAVCVIIIVAAKKKKKAALGEAIVEAIAEEIDAE